MEVHDAARRETIRQILDLEAQRISLAEETVKSGHSGLYAKACDQFGAWQVALDYAGIRLIRDASQNYLPETILRGIRRRCVALHSVRAKYVQKADRRLYREAIAAFGSWRAALQAADINRRHLRYNAANPRLKPDEILKLLRKRAEAGGSTVFADFACENQAVARAIIYYFKCWRNALIAAGIVKASGVHADEPEGLSNPQSNGTDATPQSKDATVTRRGSVDQVSQ